MNKIEEMIKQLCPNGVEWKKLGEVCKINGRIGFRGYTREDQVEKGEGAISLSPGNIRNQRIDFSDCTYITWKKYEESPEIMVNNGDIILCKTASVGKVSYIENLPEKATINPQLVLLNNFKLNGRFFYYILVSTDFQSKITQLQGIGSVPNVSQEKLSKIQIPLPPLPIQTEIVRILDKFVEQQEQLERLIELRKKQYEYYREELLTPKEGEVWETKRLGEIGTFVRGNGLQKTDFTEEGFPCIHYGQVHTYYGFSATETKSFCSETLAEKLKKASYGDLIIATTSEDVEACCKATVWLGNGKVAISGDSFLFSHNKNPKFVAHLFKTKRFADQKRMVATGAKVVRVSGESMAKFEIRIPSSLGRQKEIADALDKFENIISELKSALEASRRRYEYYRDEIMRF